MATFAQLGLGSGQTAAKDYSFLLDSLSIKENMLASDGNLSPGDYKLLKEMATQAYNHPGLTPQDRSKVAVKISEYDKGSKTKALQSNDDVTALKNDVKDEFSKQNMLLSNNPSAMVQARAEVLHLQLNKLSQIITDKQNSGSDASAEINEFNSSLLDYNDAVQAISDVGAAKTSPGKPSGSTVAYVTTNSKGEISDVQFGRVGAKSGYAETNGLYGGLQIYGKINQKSNGKNVFKIGNETFSAADVPIPDPANPGVFKTTPLVSDNQKTALGGGFSSAPAGQFKDIDISQVRPQSYIPDGNFAKSTSGFLYQNKGGKYTKYANVDPKTVGATDQNMINIPSDLEQNIMPLVSDTVDGSKPFTPPMSSSTPQINVPAASTSTPPAATSTPPAGRPVTPPPVSNAPTSTQGIAGGALDSAKNFLAGLFKK